jgi:transcriptional regulator with XRE-family HTH domain
MGVVIEPLWREVTGRALREARRRREQTLSQVAARAGISVAYLSEIERGRKEPSSEVLAAVTGALSLTLAELTTATLQLLAPLDLRAQRVLGPAGGRRPDGPVALAA